MILRCSAEPKRRYLAQSCYFDINFEPLWRKDKMHPKWQESSFRYRTAEKFAEITVSDNRFLLCPAGCVLRYNKQGLCVPKSQSKAADFLAALLFGGLPPPIPQKMNERRNNVYERYTNCRACHGKRKR